MRRHHFFITTELKEGGDLKISDTDLLHQWQKVFRMKAGDEVILLPNDGFEYICEFVLLSRKEAELKVKEKREGVLDVKKKVHLYLGMLKKDKFEWVLQKGTELGVASFTPIITARTEKMNLNMERAEKVVREAAEQSGWSTLPIINEPVELAGALERAGNPIVMNMEGGAFNTEELPVDISVFIGPEGGWDEAEENMFEFKKLPVYSVGAQTLRAETAAIAVCSKLLL